MAATWLCLLCREAFEPGDYEVCPGCGRPGLPGDLASKVTLTLTWIEVRCLVQWAERWASIDRGPDQAPEGRRLRSVIYGIADEIQGQHLGRGGLTFASELAELRSEFGQVDQNVIVEDDD